MDGGDFKQELQGQMESPFALKSLIWISFAEFRVLYMYWLQFSQAPVSGGLRWSSYWPVSAFTHSYWCFLKDAFLHMH